VVAGSIGGVVLKKVSGALEEVNLGNFSVGGNTVVVNEEDTTLYGNVLVLVVNGLSGGERAVGFGGGTSGATLGPILLRRNLLAIGVDKALIVLTDDARCELGHSGRLVESQGDFGWRHGGGHGGKADRKLLCKYSTSSGGSGLVRLGARGGSR
jgi:hypothetical protein